MAVRPAWCIPRQVIRWAQRCGGPSRWRRRIAAALRSRDASPAQVAQAGWQALWPAAEVRKRALYLFGLQSLLRFDSQGLSEFFAAFFQLPAPLWHGYLSNTLATPEVLDTMARLFGQASNRVRGTLLRSAGPGAGLLLPRVSGALRICRPFVRYGACLCAVRTQERRGARRARYVLCVPLRLCVCVSVFCPALSARLLANRPSTARSHLPVCAPDR